ANEAGVAAGTFSEIADSVLRVLGDLYRYREPTPEYPVDDWASWEDARAHLRHFVDTCAQASSASPADLPAAVWSAVCEAGQHRYMVIDPRALWVRVSRPQDPVWICPSCRREHLHRSAGICTRCLSVMPPAPSANCGELQSRNYYARQTADREAPIRLH